jgi:hypothetical protein
MNGQGWMDEANDINRGLKELETEVKKKNSDINVGATEDALDNYAAQIESLASKGADVDTVQDLKQVVEMIRTKLNESRVFGGRSKRSRRQRSKRRKSRRSFRRSFRRS